MPSGWPDRVSGDDARIIPDLVLKGLVHAAF